jgi:hypothetical protein
MAETTVERLLCCGFQRTDKATGEVYPCWQRICRDVNVFSRFEYHVFYVLHPFVAYLLTLPRKYNLQLQTNNTFNSNALRIRSLKYIN